MKEKARVLLWNKNTDEVLLMKRQKGEETYYVIPGGSLEEGEDYRQAAIREIKEEVSFNASENDLILFVRYEDETSRSTNYYIPIEETFTPVLGGEEARKNNHLNIYRPEWVSMNELSSIPIRPAFMAFEIQKHCTVKRKKLETVELTNMCLVEDGDKILLEDRHKDSWSGYAMPGGHVEPGESFVASVKREIFEETGLTILDPKLVGIKQFPIEEGRYIVFLFKATKFTGTIKDSEEGHVAWFHRDELTNLKTVSGFFENLQVMDNPDLSEMQYYEDENDSRRLLLS